IARAGSAAIQRPATGTASRNTVGSLRRGMVMVLAPSRFADGLRGSTGVGRRLLRCRLLGFLWGITLAEPARPELAQRLEIGLAHVVGGEDQRAAAERAAFAGRPVHGDQESTAPLADRKAALEFRGVPDGARQGLGLGGAGKIVAAARDAQGAV